jgi:hypothetical protein
MASDPTNGGEQSSFLARAIADISVAVALVACLAGVYGLEGSSWQRLIGNGQHQSRGKESQAAVSEDVSDAAASAERPSAPTREADGAAVDAPAADESLDDAEVADADGGSGTSKADGVADDSVRRKPTGIIAGFEAFKPELLPQKPPMQPELTKQPVPPPVVPEPIAEPVVGKPKPAKIEFFDTETKAVSVGFVVDCSSSMDGAKFQAVCAELAKSITALKPEQQFFVVFFNDGFFPMTGNAHQPKLLPANRENKKNILRFLNSAKSGGGTNPEPALQFMVGLQPEVIYLLTDGGFNPLSPGTYNNLSAARIVVHTIGFETGGPIPILQEIASRTSGTFRSAAMTGINSGMFFADPRVVRAALADADPSVRREAVSVALIRELPFVGEMISMLADSDASVRSEVHDELRNLAQGTDFGPADAGDVPDAIKRWKLWWSLRKSTRDKLLVHLSGDDADARWVAASLARTSGLDAPDELIAAMRVAPSPVWQELHVAIVQCCIGQDFGPAPSASAEQVVEAADRWAAWRVEEREKAARELLAKRTKLAAEKLRLARELIEINPEAVVRRCRDLMRDFADTPSAAEAKELFEELGGDESE